MNKIMIRVLFCAFFSVVTAHDIQLVFVNNQTEVPYKIRQTGQVLLPGLTNIYVWLSHEPYNDTLYLDAVADHASYQQYLERHGVRSRNDEHNEYLNKHIRAAQEEYARAFGEKPLRALGEIDQEKISRYSTVRALDGAYAELDRRRRRDNAANVLNKEALQEEREQLDKRFTAAMDLYMAVDKELALAQALAETRAKKEEKPLASEPVDTYDKWVTRAAVSHISVRRGDYHFGRSCRWVILTVTAKNGTVSQEAPCITFVGGQPNIGIDITQQGAAINLDHSLSQSSRITYKD